VLDPGSQPGQLRPEPVAHPAVNQFALTTVRGVACRADSECSALTASNMAAEPGIQGWAWRQLTTTSAGRGRGQPACATRLAVEHSAFGQPGRLGGLPDGLMPGRLALGAGQLVMQFPRAPADMDRSASAAASIRSWSATVDPVARVGSTERSLGSGACYSQSYRRRRPAALYIVSSAINESGRLGLGC
jgi:hypothetical protein